MQKNFKGEAIYTAEVDVHFPNMTVGQTLAFAAKARMGRNVPGGLSRHEFAGYLVCILAFGSLFSSLLISIAERCYHGGLWYQSYHQHQGWK